MLSARELRQRAEAAGFGDIAGDLARLARPALVLRPSARGREVGRLGGLPRLPAGTAWPRTRWTTIDPRPLAFFAALDLAALDPDVWPGPRSGTLSVFCHVNAEALYVDSGGAALVLHHLPEISLEPVEAPDDLPDELRYPEMRVVAGPVTTVPWIGVGAARELIPLGLDDLQDYERTDRYCEMAAGLMGRRDHGTPHQLLGWPQFTQDDVGVIWPQLHDEAIGHGTSSGAVAPEDWRLLLQIGADQRLGASFGDGGALFFAIPADDLAAGRFDRVQAISDSG